MSRSILPVSLASAADLDFLEIMDWSVEHFGTAADRYEALHTEMVPG